MIKQLLLIAVLALTSFTAFAQLGVKAGVNFSSITNDVEDVSEENVKIGLHAGLVYQLELNNWFSVQPEILYIRKGGEYNYLDTEVESKIGYVEVPISFRFIPLGGPVHLEIGPQFSYMTDVEYTFDNATFDTESVVSDDPDDYNRTDIGGLIGVGVNFENFALNLRYTRGFNNVDKDRTIESIIYEEGSKNNNVLLSATFYL